MPAQPNRTVFETGADQRRIPACSTGHPLLTASEVPPSPPTGRVIPPDNAGTAHPEERSTGRVVLPVVPTLV